MGEEAREAGEGDLAPAIELVGMQAVLGGELVGRLLFFEQVAHDLRFEGGAVRLFMGSAYLKRRRFCVRILGDTI
jgi:hypothetical protein